MASIKELKKRIDLRDLAARPGGDDDGTKRMAASYAAVLLSWGYVCEFEIPYHNEFMFATDLLADDRIRYRQIGQFWPVCFLAQWPLIEKEKLCATT